MSQHKKMGAILVKGSGVESSLFWSTSTDVPELHSGEVKIKVHCSALNRADTLQRKGFYPPPTGASEIIGLEAAGEIVEIKDCEQKWKIGDRVMVLVAGGGYAEYCVVPEGQVMLIPEGLSFYQAASIPETWLTAYQLLYTIGKLQKNEIVLIHAGASGIGTAAIQMAVQTGAKVIVTCSKEKMKYCKHLGAIEAIDYKLKNNPWSEQLLKILEIQRLQRTGVDLILDCVGAHHTQMNIDSLAMDGRWILFGLMGGGQVEKFPLASILRKRATLIGTTLRTRSKNYKKLLVANFRNDFLHMFSPTASDTPLLYPVIDSVFPIIDADKAHKYMESNKSKGKIILEVIPSTASTTITTTAMNDHHEDTLMNPKERPMILVVHGQGIDTRGSTEESQKVFGTLQMADYNIAIKEWAKMFDVDVTIYQTNDVIECISKLNATKNEKCDAIVINPGGWCKGEDGKNLAMCLKSLEIPAVEVHYSNPYAKFVSTVSSGCRGVVVGIKLDSYKLGMLSALNMISADFTKNDYKAKL